MRAGRIISIRLGETRQHPFCRRARTLVVLAATRRSLEVPPPGPPPGGDAPARAARLRSVRCRLPVRRREPAIPVAGPGHPLRTQRRAHDLEAPESHGPPVATRALGTRVPQGAAF